MRRILFIILLLSIGMTGHAQEVKLDSASYAYGDKIIRSVIESKDSIFPKLKFDKENLAVNNVKWYVRTFFGLRF